MIGSIVFDFPLGWQIGLPVAIIAVLVASWSRSRRGLRFSQVLALGGLRALALLLIVFLVSRPVWIAKEPPASASRSVMILLDRSESMSLEEPDVSRFQRAIAFARDRLLPALKSADLRVQGMLFDQAAEAVEGDTLAAARPNGKRTNLAGAIAQAIASAPQPPIAVIALTDGIVNQTSDNARALALLSETAAPFIGVGFGSDQGVRTLSLRDVNAPASVCSKTAFTLSAQLEMMNTEELPAFDIVLFRDGQMHKRKTVSPGKGSRTWLESFSLTEEKEGMHNYSVQLMPPDVSGLKCVNTLSSASVRISDEKDLRILYIQGGRYR